MFDGSVRTSLGTVRGVERDGVWQFLGIPYGAAPTGELRFRPTEAPAPWSGVRDATEFGPIAPQAESGLGSYVPGDPVERGEDCLSINVWTLEPAPAPRPVMVFLHGGAFLSGSGGSVTYRGEHFARRGVILVTFNYRLGALGFLAHRALAQGPGSPWGNWGLYDQVSALRWVRDNIAAFGGDAGRVTVFGESAGAMSVCDLLATPAAAGLFQRAIVESGFALALREENATATAKRFFALLGVDEPDRELLAKVPVEEIVEAQRALSAEVDEGAGMPFQPVVDGALLTRHPADLIAAGSAAGVELLIGTNRDEFKFFSFASLRDRPIGLEEVEGFVARYLRGGRLLGRIEPAELVEEYRSARSARGDAVDGRSLLDAIAGDWIFRLPALRLAEAQSRHNSSTYCYLFDWESPFASGLLGACHALELPFVFGSVANPIVGIFSGSGPDAFELSAQMQGAWVAFAEKGDPSVAGANAPDLEAWPAYDPANRATMRFGPATHLEFAPYEQERRFFDERLGRYGVDGPVEGARPSGVALLAPEAGDEAPGTGT